jgi:hypothetical protein
MFEQALFGSIGNRFAIGKNSVNVLQQVMNGSNDFKHVETSAILSAPLN